MRRLLARVAPALLAAATAGCAATPGPLAAGDLVEVGPALDAWADPDALDAAQREGVVSSASVAPAAAGGRDDLRVVVAEGLRDGAVRDLVLWCERGLGHAARALRPWAFVASPRDGAAMEAALAAAGAARGELVSVVPDKRLTAWRTSKGGLYLVYERAPGDGGGALWGVARAPDDRTLDDLLPGARRWAAVVRRVERAVETGARLEQVRDEVLCVEAIPFPDERERARPIFDVFARELDERRAAIEAAWPTADLAARCDLARQAVDGAAAARGVDDGRHRALAERLVAEVRGQLVSAAVEAERAGAGFTAAGWCLTAATFGGPEVARLTAQAAALVTPRVRAVLPGLAGPAFDAPRPGLDALWGERVLGLAPGLLGRHGLAPTRRAAHAREAGAGAGRLEVGPLQGDLTAHEERRTVVHHFTRPNPDWARWSQAMSEVDARLAAAISTAAATENYTSTVKEAVQVVSGSVARTKVNAAGVVYTEYETTYRTEYRDRTVVDEAKKRTHERACAARDALQVERARLAKLEPPRRLPAQAEYEERLQVWTGALRREVALDLDGQRHTLAQEAPAPGHRVRTAGSQASDLPEENVPPADGWTTAEAIARDDLRRFDEALAELVRPLLVAALERRLEADVARRVTGDGRDDERVWARLFFGLPGDPATAARLRAALGPAAPEEGR